MTGREISPRLWRSIHYRNGRFFNPEGPRQRFSHFLKWVTHRQKGPWRNFIPSDPGPKPPERINGSELSVTFVNHATFLLQTEGCNILTDPVWSERVSPVSFAGPRRHRKPGIRFEDLPAIDGILLSHTHYDHFDIPTLKMLCERHRPAIFCPLKVGRILSNIGFKEIYELDWWKDISWRGVSVHCVPAQHFSARSPFDRDRTLWCGWILRASAGDIYFAGDTGFGGLFDEIAREFNRIRLALLPIGAYEPEWFMGPIHMTPEQAVRAHVALRTPLSIATHFGTFQLADDGETDPPVRLSKALNDTDFARQFWMMREGESRSIPDLYPTGQPIAYAGDKQQDDRGDHQHKI